MKLEICHPNELIHNGWKFVEEVGDDWQDHLRSPSFEWYRGLLVRVEDQYTGIFNASECVDVGFLSDVVLGLIAHEPHRTRVFVGGKSFPEAWRTSNDPENMVTTLQNILQSTDRLSPALLACVDHQINTSDRKLFKNILDDIKFMVDNKSRNLNAIIKSLENFSGATRSNSVANAMWSLARSISDIQRSSDVIYYLNSDKDKAVDQELADILRREIPFHEIAEDLVR